MNYQLFYEQVERILELEIPVETKKAKIHTEKTWQDTPAYHASIEKELTAWVAMNGYIRPALTIEELAGILHTNRTYLSAYIKSTYHVSFREWIAGLRIEYAKQLLQQPEMTVSAVSEATGFLSLSYFTKIFTEKEGCSPSKWRKQDVS